MGGRGVSLGIHDETEPAPFAPSRVAMNAFRKGGAIVLALVTLAVVARDVSAQGPHLNVDARPESNGPTEAGPINGCVSVTSGESFDIDITISDVEELLAWEIYFEYDPSVVEIVDRDVRLFQAANRGSAVYDVSERLPDDDGLYRLAAADIADPPSPDSGSGALARLTLRAIAPGTSTAAITLFDVDGDGKPDLGPFLRNTDGDPIGDADGDAFFDGAGASATIAVDADCPPGSGGPNSATGGSNGRSTRVAIILATSLAVAAATVGAFVYLHRRRARAEPQ